jgi:O-antigen/teichoic acid export membrane protein
MQRKTANKDFFWNMVGSVCYSLSSFYYLMMVTRICGVTDGGIFALAFSTAQLLLTLGRYGMRTYQATDTSGRYSFSEYGLTRILTCAGMVAFAGVYGAAAGYPAAKTWVFVWVAALKMVDAAEDVFHGELQRNFRVALMGKMLALRNIFSCVVFGVAIVSTRNLIATCMATAVLSIVFCLLINFAALRRVHCAFGASRMKEMKTLMVTCFPIFVSTFLSLYLYNIPKYAIDKYMAVEYQTYYSVLFMPSFVITLFSEIITKPMLTTISIAWENDLKKFVSIIRNIFLLIAGGTVAVILGGHLLGRYLLELIYAVDLEPYKLHFIVLLAGGGISAAVYISYNILISIRFQKWIIAAYLAVTVVATPMTYLVVKHFGMMGAAWSYLLTCLLLDIIFTVLLLWKIHNKRKEK